MIKPEQKSALKNELGGFMFENEALAPKTALKTGGPAAVFLQPRTLTELELALKNLTRLGLEFMILGGGSNLLIADGGIQDRVVISLDQGFQDYKIIGSDNDSVMIQAGSAVRLAALVQLSLTGGYSGWENLAGIPGTLGGALAMNAGAYGVTIYDYLSRVSLWRGTELLCLARAELNPVYRNGGLKDNDIVIKAWFHLPRTDAGKVAEKIAEINHKRRQRLPAGRNAGSVFKNPAGDYAARLLDKAGCKGLTCGGAQVAAQHANVIVAEKGAHSQDIKELMVKMQERVRQRFGVVLEPEIRIY